MKQGSLSQLVAGRLSQRLGSYLAIFALAILASAGFYAGVQRWAPNDSLLVRYVAGHWVEYVETGLFFWAILALAEKGWKLGKERRALKVRLLPGWSGEPVPVRQAGDLLADLNKQPTQVRETVAGRRVAGALEFVQNRGATAGLDEHLRALADGDFNALEGSYSLIRFITWAIPILGFLGTVLGITEAIANVTPEQLARSITGVTDGLAVAFDTTAIALIYSMIIMFFTFVMDRRDQALLQVVDSLIEEEIVYRFERPERHGDDAIALVRRSHEELLRGAEQLVTRQAQLWAESLQAVQQRVQDREKEVYDHLSRGLKAMLEETQAAHQRRLYEMERHAAEGATTLGRHFDQVGCHLGNIIEALQQQQEKAQAQAQLGNNLLEAEQHILRLQETMNQNLESLARSGDFHKAVHSLAAAIHLLTARLEALPAARGESALPLLVRKGNAA